MADYHSLLMRAVANLPNSGTPATRGAIYERARKALLEQLRSLRPPLPEGDITREETALDAAIAEIEERYGPQDPAPPLASPPPTPPVAGKPVAAPRPAPPPPPHNSLRSSAPARLRRPGRPLPRLERLRKPVRQANPGPQPCPFRARRSDLRRRHQEGPSQPEARSKRQPRSRGGRPQRRRRWLRRLDPSWLLQWPTSPPPYRGPDGPLHRWGRRTARMKVCPDWRRSTRPRRSDRTRPTTGTRPTLHPLSRAVAMNLGNGPTRPKWRRSSTAPAWLPDRRRRCSARLRQASKSPSRNACSGSRRRSSLELSLRWPEPQS